MRTFLALTLLVGVTVLSGCGGKTVCTERPYARTAYYNPADDYVGYGAVDYTRYEPVAEAVELPAAETSAVATVAAYEAPEVVTVPTKIARANVLTCDPCAGL